MNRVVCDVRGADQEFGIECVISSMDNIALGKRIHVMNYQTSMDIITFDTQITPFVSNDYFLTKLPPLPGRIKLLIDPSVEPKCFATNYTFQRKVIEPVFEHFQSS